LHERLELGAHRCRGRLEAQRVAVGDVNAVETQKMEVDMYIEARTTRCTPVMASVSTVDGA